MIESRIIVSSPQAFPTFEGSVESKRSPLRNAIKLLLANTRSVVPESIYQPVYDVLFRSYKDWLRKLYFRNVAWHWLSRDRKALFRSKLVHSVMPFSLVGSDGLEATFDAAWDLAKHRVPGDFVECGVAQGGCSALMATVAKLASPPRRMWLFDSFEGLPSPTTDDYDQNRKSTGNHVRPLVRGSCLGTREQVEWLLFSRFGLDRNSTFLVKGWFQHTLPVHKERIGPIALLRIDGDWYESTKCCLENLYDSVSLGGYVIVDDYGVCFGCKMALHEFFERKGIHPRLVPDSRGGVRFSKES